MIREKSVKLLAILRVIGFSNKKYIQYLRDSILVESLQSS
jgi:hypothetical protein